VNVGTQVGDELAGGSGGDVEAFAEGLGGDGPVVLLRVELVFGSRPATTEATPARTGGPCHSARPGAVGHRREFQPGTGCPKGTGAFRDDQRNRILAPFTVPSAPRSCLRLLTAACDCAIMTA